jgi:hypothetical protein
VYDEEKNILHWADKSSQGITKISCTGMPSPTNQQRKDPFSFVLFESPFTSVSTDGMGHPSLVSLITTDRRFKNEVGPVQYSTGLHQHFGKVSARCKKFVDILIFIKQVGNWQQQEKFKKAMLFDVVEIGTLFSFSLP